MRKGIRRGMRGVLGALVVGAMGFGATQALAAPGQAAAAGTCNRDEAGACNASCRETYGTGWVGQCYKNSWGHVSCGCVQLTFPS
jgi:hypothetical protein